MSRHTGFLILLTVLRRFSELFKKIAFFSNIRYNKGTIGLSEGGRGLFLQILLYSLLHMLICGLSAYVLIARFSGSVPLGWSLFLYSFAALALQPVFGMALDLIRKKQKKDAPPQWDVPALTAMLGLLITLLGAVTHPVVLGIGNSFFHVGGGVGTIEKDREKHWKGRALGVFVASGALGLFLGKHLGKALSDSHYFLILGTFLMTFSILSATLLFWLRRSGRTASEDVTLSKEEFDFRYAPQAPLSVFAVFSVLLCFLSAMLRAYAGTAISFIWADGFGMELLAVGAVALGIISGVFFAARTSFSAAMIFSLIPAAFLYWFKDIPVLGVGALFLFHMSTPITLYMVANRLRDLPGFAFGLLSLGCFLGILPVYLKWDAPIDAKALGTLISAMILILLILALVLLIREHRKNLPRTEESETTAEAVKQSEKKKNTTEKPLP